MDIKTFNVLPNESLRSPWQRNKYSRRLHPSYTIKCDEMFCTLPTNTKPSHNIIIEEIVMEKQG